MVPTTWSGLPFLFTVLNAPAASIHPCQPTVATKPPTGPGWAHELKHDGYRLQIHVRDGRVRFRNPPLTPSGRLVRKEGQRPRLE